MKVFSICVFVSTYILMLIMSKRKSLISISGALLIIIFKVIPITKLLNYIDINVIMMLLGVMGIVILFIESKMTFLIAEKIVDFTKNIKWSIIFLSMFAGIISAFIDNVATVLMIAPIAISICNEFKISPTKAIIAISISSNLQGAATLVGDTTSIILGNYLGLNFGDFFIINGKIGMFFITQIGALTASLTLIYTFRKENQKIINIHHTKVSDYFPSILLILLIICLIIASFLSINFDYLIGTICVSLFLIGLFYEAIIKKDKKIISKVFKNIDYSTILMIFGVFIIIGGLSETGVMNDIGMFFIKISGNNIFIIYTLIVFSSVMFSSVIDNIPYITTMLPIVSYISNYTKTEPFLLFFGLLVGATLGGNLTPIGASANITALGLLKKSGYNVKTLEFMKISVPFTLIAVISGYILLWLTWGQNFL